MKKLFTLFVAVMMLSIASYAQVCNVDTLNTKVGITPNDTTAPPAVIGVPFDTVAQIYVPSSFTINYNNIPITATIYWIYIDTVTNFPAGINYYRNPGVSDTIYGGQRQCFRISGTTNSPAGVYNLVFTGLIHIKVLTYDTIVPLSELSAFAGQGGPTFGYFLKVAYPAGINNIGSNFNSSLNVYPNPTSGKFDLSLTNVDKVDGDISVYDMTGRRVYTQKVDATGFYSTSIDLSNCAKGLYTVQVKTANGVASKNISVE